MNEDGVEAAAVTVIVLVPSSASVGPEEPPEVVLFLADHPFQFFIIYETNNDEDLVLFEGRVGDPGIPEGSSAPLTATHSEATFWKDLFFVEATLPQTAEEATANGSKNFFPTIVWTALVSAIIACLIH